MNAWVKIWNKYYDPTFDDPIWIQKTKLFHNYKYFWLPKDLFYVNRYSYESLPESIKNSSSEERNQIIVNNLSKLTKKYNNQNYLLLAPYIFKKKHWISANKQITITELEKAIWSYIVDNFSFYQWWKKKQILKLNYFKLSDDWLDTLLSQIHYNFDWYYLFKWKLKDWSYEYRLAYDLEF